MAEIKSIQWFPGHMTKTRRLIQANLSLVDAVVELTDARIPLSSRNPEIDKLIKDKPRLILMNKCDMADPKATEQWIKYYKSKGIMALATDCKSGKGVKQFSPAIKEVLSELLARRAAKGMSGRTIQIMIVGIPNVGKSSLINKLAQSKKTKVADKPGVTRTKQWVKLDKDIELLDTPGVLWPKFDDQKVAEKLAFTGAIKDDIMDIEGLTMNLLEFLKVDYSSSLVNRYGIEVSSEDSGFQILEKIGKKRGMLISGGEINIERAAITVLDEFRAGKLGKFTFDKLILD